MGKRQAILVLVLLAMLISVAGPVQADLLMFNAQPTQGYTTPTTIQEGSYVFRSNFYGLGTFYDGNFHPGNGTMHLLSWSNWQIPTGSSGFTLTHEMGSAFEVSSFDFAGGQANNANQGVSSLIVRGYSGANLIQTQSFYPGIHFNGQGPGQTLRTLSLAGFSGIESLVVEATGYDNIAGYDNFVVSAVPEASSLSLIAINAFLVTVGNAFRRRRR
jgi:hypothetical protein